MRIQPSSKPHIEEICKNLKQYHSIKFWEKVFFIINILCALAVSFVIFKCFSPLGLISKKVNINKYN